MAFNNAKNYMESADEWVIGGKLTLLDGATVEGMEATPTAAGGVKLAAPVADDATGTAASLKTTVNALLASLREAGVLGEAAAITAQPQDVTAAAGGTGVFTVTAKGSGLTYQWQSKASSSVANYTNSMHPGYNTDTLSVPAATSRNGSMFRCVVTDAFGNSVNSDGATLTVT